jgi:hypothetical protein
MGEAAGPGVDQLGKPPAHERRPLVPREGLSSGGESLGLGLGRVLADRASVHLEGSGHLGLGPAGVPVQQDLDDVDHRERPPCHQPPHLGG